METYKTVKDSVFWTADDGEWVPADVAQKMYDALIAIENDEHSSLIGTTWDKMQAALAAADGEEI